MTSSDNDQMYLSDDPIKSEEDDSFGHKEYVDTLSQIIQNVDPAWHVGIFGEWGSGKSSIINLLYERIREETEFDNVLCVEFDAWAYAEGSVRTELLLELDQEIGKEINGEDSDGVLGEEEITGRLYDVEEEEEIKKESNPKQIIKNFWSDSPILAIIFVGLGIGALALEYFGNSAAASVVATGLLFPVLGYILQQLDTVAQTIQRKFLHPRKEWTGAYQRIFDAIIQETKAEKVVITVDNLDRCESGTVYDVLVSLKTFLEDDRCIYLIPCDDEALESHLRAINEEDFFGETRSEREFLRKFFQTHIRIPPFQKEDVESYAHEQNKELSDTLDDEAIDIVVNAYFENPRRIKHAINRLVTLRSIAREREQEDILGDGRITENMPFLAKISIIEEEFSGFYEELEEDPYLLDDINAYLKEELQDPDKSERVADILEEDGRGESRLKAFLSSTQRVTTENIRPFLTLSEQSFSAGLQDFDEVMRFLKTGKQSELLDRIKDVHEKGNSFDQYCNAIDAELEEYQSIDRDQPMYAIINSLVEISGDLEEGEQREVSKVVGKYLTRDPGREFTPYLDTGSILPMLTLMPRHQSQRLFEDYAEQVNRDGLQEGILSAFIANARAIPANAVSKLSENVTALDEEELKDALNLLGDSEAAKEELVTSEIIEKAVTLLEIDTGKNEYIQTPIYGQFDDIASVEDRSKFVERLLDLRDDYSGNQARQLDESFAEVLNGLSPELTSETTEKLFTSVKERLNQNTEHVGLVKTCLRFFISLPAEAQDEFRDWISTIFGRWNQQNVKQVFEDAANSEYPVFETEKEVDQLLSRIPGHINDESFVVEEIVPAIPPKFDEKIVEKTCELVRANNNQKNIGFRIIEEHPNRLDDGFSQVIDACGHEARHENNTNRKRELLMPIARQFSILDSSEQESFIGELENLLRGNAGDYKLYKDIWLEFADEADSDRRAAVAADLLEDVTERVNSQDPDHLTPVIEILQSMPGTIEKGQGQVFMERLSDRLTDQNLNLNQQETVIEQITGFTEFYGKEEQIIDRVEAALNRNSNQSMRDAAEELIARLDEQGDVDEERLDDIRENHLS